MPDGCKTGGCPYLARPYLAPDVSDVVDDPLKAGKSALEGILGGQKKDKEDGE